MRTKIRATAKVCLRCDWEGETGDGACPSCGAALWRPRVAAEPRPPSRFARARARMAERAERNQQIATGVPATAPRQVAESEALVEPHDRRSRAVAWVSVAAVIVVAVVAVVIVRAGTPGNAPLASTAFVGGRVLYVAPDPTLGGRRIWVWNLETGVVQAGPRVEDVISLLDASDAGQGRVAVISTTQSGGQEAGVLRFLEPTDVPVPVLDGRFAAWSAGGRLASAITVSPGAGARGCDVVAVQTFEAVATRVSETWSGTLCGDVVDLHRTLNEALISVDGAPLGGGPPKPAVFSVPTRRTSLRLADVRLLGVSRGGSLFLVDPRPGGGGTLLGLAFDAHPAPYVDGADPFLVELPLSGTWNGDGAFFLGELGGVRGVYRVPGFGKIGPKTPELVFATDAVEVAVSETSRGVPVILADGRFYGVGEEESTELFLPEDAPPPSGPIVWLAREDDGS